MRTSIFRLAFSVAIVLTGVGTLRAETPIPRMKEQTLSILLGIQVRQRSKPVISTGSGFVIGDGRQIVTNNHVCCGSAPKGMTETGRALFVRISREDDGLIPATVLWANPAKDLAILQLEKPLDRPPATLALSSTVKDAQRVFAMGFPGGAGAVTDSESSLVVKITTGIISAMVQGNSRAIDSQLYQIDAPLNPGNSGGPLFDTCGRVIGVNVAKATEDEGIAWAIRVDELLPQFETLGIDADVTEVECATESGGSSTTLMALQIASIILALGASAFAVTRRGRRFISKRLTTFKTNAGKEKRQKPSPTPPPMPPTAAKPVLRGLAGYYDGTTIELSDRPWVLGRDARASNLVFPPDLVGISKRHCRVSYDPARRVFLLEDTWSSNGIFLQDGSRVSAGQVQELQDGSRFYLADEHTLFEVTLESD